MGVRWSIWQIFSGSHGRFRWSDWRFPGALRGTFCYGGAGTLADAGTPTVMASLDTSSAAPASSSWVRLLRRLVIWGALAAGAWWAWPHIPDVVKTPFYAARLSMMEAPVALAMPVQGVNPARVTDTWGGARSGGRRHEGVDIFAPRGTPVLSATEGIVTRVGTNNLGGQVVWVLGPAGQRHYYAHLDSYADIGAGDRVQVGTVLGAVGNTGNARGTPPHLHYGVYGREGAFNPYPLLRAAAGP